MIIYIPKSKLWYWVNGPKNIIKVFNDRDKLSYESTSAHFKGSAGVRSSTVFRQQLEQSNWKESPKTTLINSLKCKTFSIQIKPNTGKNEVINYLSDMDKLTKNSTVTGTKILACTCAMAVALPLSEPESYFLSLVYGLPSLKYLPIESTITYQENKQENFITTLSVTKNNTSIEAILPKGHFTQCTSELKAYNLTREISPMVKDILGL